MRLLSRFRAWLVSVEFAVTATSVVAALVGGSALSFSHVAVERDALAVVMLAGIAVPNVFIDSWMDVVDSHLAGVAWALGACVAVVACYLLVAAGVQAVAGGPAGTVIGFIVTWVLALLASRKAT